MAFVEPLLHWSHHGYGLIPRELAGEVVQQVAQPAWHDGAVLMYAENNGEGLGQYLHSILRKSAQCRFMHAHKMSIRLR